MDKMQTNTKEQITVAPDHLENLLRQYPWFSKEEIVEAIQRFDNRRERIIPYLDMKSGSWYLMDLGEF
jgi:hypothetical protein